MAARVLRVAGSKRMKPEINGTTFGSITIDGETFDHDVMVRLTGEVAKRKKKLLKKVTGSSHVVSVDEAQCVYEQGAERLIVGCGQQGLLRLSDEAQTFLAEHSCATEVLPTGQAVAVWNQAQEKVIGLFHVTC